MKTVTKIICTLIAVAMIFAVLYSIVDGLAFSTSFYDREYRKLGRAEHIGMSHEDLMKTTQKLIDYMSGRSPDMVVSAVINGVEREVFNEQETVHMADVVVLFQSFSLFRWISFGAFAAAAVLFAAVIKRNRLFIAAKIILWACGISALILAALGVWAAIDFQSFWTAFHELLFTNNLWLFDEKTSVMINMFPWEFFFDFIMYFLIWTAAAIGVPFALSVFVAARQRRRA